MGLENLNHCCKGVCSGWDDGYQEGITAAIVALSDLKLKSAAKEVGFNFQWAEALTEHFNVKRSTASNSVRHRVTDDTLAE